MSAKIYVVAASVSAVLACGRTPLNVSGGAGAFPQSGGASSAVGAETTGGDGTGGYAHRTTYNLGGLGLGTGGWLAGIGGSSARQSSSALLVGGSTTLGTAIATGGVGTGGSLTSSAIGGASDAGLFYVAKPGLGLTDIGPLLTPSDYYVTCAASQCRDAMACSNDLDCAVELSCLANDCQLAAQLSQADPSLVQRAACQCMMRIATDCAQTTDVQGCLGHNCSASSLAGTLSGLGGLKCLVTFCLGQQLC